MKHLMHRMIWLVCTAAVGTTALLSCGGNETTETKSGNDTQTPADTSSVLSEEIRSALPDKDYNGRTFTVTSPASGTRYLPGQILTEEESGDIIMDAAYIRNRNVEEQFNISIAYLPMDAAVYYNTLRSSILAGDSSYDLACGFLQSFASLAMEPLFLDVSDLPYVDLNNPWYAETNEALRIKGRQSLIFSDYTCITLACTYGMFYNSDMAEIYELPDLQQLALDGAWTIDRLLDYSKGITTDLNGDSKLDENDRYGCGAYFNILQNNNDTSVVYQYGMESFTTMLDENGEPKLTLYSDRQSEIVNKLYSLYFEDNRSNLVTDNIKQAEMFANNQVLFFTAIIMHAPNYMRDMTDDYKILPIPKFDEQQNEYHTTISQTSSFLYGVPATAADPEFSSIIFDALSYEGYRNVIPAFFEISMKTKYSRDEISSQMFDLLRSSTYVDFGLIFDGGVGMSYLISSVLAGKNTNFASAYTALEPKAIKQYASVIESMNE